MDKRFVAAILGIAGMAGGVFLPFISIMGQSMNYFKSPDGDIADGLFVLIAAGLALIFTLIKRYKLNLIPVILGGGILAYTYMQLSDLTAQAGGMADLLEYGIGWIVIIVGLLFLLASVFLKAPQKDY